MEAIQESVEDYEYLRMLRDAVRRDEPMTRSVAEDRKLKQAKRLLATAADRVLAARGAQDTIWDQPKDRGVADRVRGEILDMLESLPAER
jgi:tRNA-dihydrouridine synthase